jgi:hypothetical protein
MPYRQSPRRNRPLDPEHIPLMHNAFGIPVRAGSEHAIVRRWWSRTTSLIYCLEWPLVHCSLLSTSRLNTKYCSLHCTICSQSRSRSLPVTLPARAGKLSFATCTSTAEEVASIDVTSPTDLCIGSGIGERTHCMPIRAGSRYCSNRELRCRVCIGSWRFHRCCQKLYHSH